MFTDLFIHFKVITFYFQEEILSSLSVLLDEAREEFPRLYFMADRDLIAMLSISRNPQALMPFAVKCFNGIQCLTYALPVELATSAMSSLDFTLNGIFFQI